MGLDGCVGPICLGGGLVDLGRCFWLHQKKAMERENARVKARIDANREALGTLNKSKKRR